MSVLRRIRELPQRSGNPDPPSTALGPPKGPGKGCATCTPDRH